MIARPNARQCGLSGWRAGPAVVTVVRRLTVVTVVKRRKTVSSKLQWATPVHCSKDWPDGLILTIPHKPSWL